MSNPNLDRAMMIACAERYRLCSDVMETIERNFEVATEYAQSADIMSPIYRRDIDRLADTIRYLTGSSSDDNIFSMIRRGDTHGVFRTVGASLLFLSIVTSAAASGKFEAVPNNVKMLSENKDKLLMFLSDLAGKYMTTITAEELRTVADDIGKMLQDKGDDLADAMCIAFAMSQGATHLKACAEFLGEDNEQ